MGSTPVEAGQVDQLCETVRDIKDAYQKVRNIKDEAEKKTAMDKWFAEDLPNWMSLAEKSLPAGSGPFLVAGKISLADILFYTAAGTQGLLRQHWGCKGSLSIHSQDEGCHGSGRCIATAQGVLCSTQGDHDVTGGDISTPGRLQSILFEDLMGFSCMDLCSCW